MRVVVAYDFSPGAKAALREAVRLFPKADVMLAYAAPVPAAGRDTGMPEGPSTLDLVAAAERELCEEARVAGIPSPEATVAFGSPDDVVLRCVGDFQPDVLAVGTHLRSGLSRMVLGSVAEKLVRRAVCPVLVVHG